MMSFYDEDDVLEDFDYNQAFGINAADDQIANSYNGYVQEPSTSGTGMLPVGDLGYDSYGLNDNSLTDIPIETQYVDTSSYQYEELQMPMEMRNQQPAYNSFEQPVVVNGFDSPLPQQVYYQTEPPSTSGMQPVPQQPNQHHQAPMHPMMNQNPPPRSSNQQVQLQHQQQPQTVMSSNGPGPMQQQVQQPRPPQQRQAQPKSTPKNRPIKPKNPPNRQRNNNNNGMNNQTVGGVLTSVNRMASSSNKSEIRLTPEMAAQVAQLLAQKNSLEAQNHSGFYTSQIEELVGRISDIFLGVSQAQNVDGTIINQLTQEVNGVAAPPPPPQPTPARKPAPRRNNQPNVNATQQMLQHPPMQQQHQQQPQQQMPQYSQANHQYSNEVYISQPDSPQYQPNYIHSQPSTSVASGTTIYTDYSPQAIKMEQQNSQPRQQTYRVIQQQPMQTVNPMNVQVTTSYQTPQGPMYVEHNPVVSNPQQPQYVQSTPGPPPNITPRNSRAKAPQPRHVIVQQQQQTRVVMSPGPIIVSHPQQQQPIQTLRQTVPIQAPMMPVQAPPRPPPPLPRPVRQTGEDANRKCLVRREQRKDKVKDFMKVFHESMQKPDSERPFTDMKDTLMRLLPFHYLQEPVLNEEEIEQFDDNYLRHMINMEMDKQRIERRIRGTLFKETMNQREREECNLLLFLDSEYEKRKLEEEKQNINDGNRADFVHRSDLIPHLIGAPSTSNALPRPKDLDKTYMFYDYHPFSEIPRPISPYKSPSPVKSRQNSIRSSSPLKSRSPSKSWSPLKSPSVMSPPPPKGPRARTISTTSSASSVPVNRPVAPARIRKIPMKEPRSAAVKQPPVPVVKVEDTFSDTVSVASVASLKDIKPLAPPPRPEIPVKKVERSRKASNTSRLSEEKPIHKEPAKEIKREEVRADPPLMRLPVKKGLLSRVRTATPLALRSPPAHNSRNSWDIVKKPIENGVDTDGSCSPELGLDDGFDTVVPSVSGNKAGSSVENASPEMLPPEPFIQEKPVIKQKPIPPPIPSKNREPLKIKEPVAKRSLDETASRTVADQPRILFKPQVPRPSSQASSHVKKETPVTRKESKVEKNATEDPKLVATPKIRLKLLGGIYEKVDVDSSESRSQGTSKEKKKKKKKKHKRERDKSPDSDDEIEKKKLHLDTEGAITVTPVAGSGLKFRFSRTSRTSTPNGDARIIAPKSEPTKTNSSAPLPQRPAVTPMQVLPPLKIKLKIPYISRSPSLPQNSPVIVSVPAPVVVTAPPIVPVVMHRPARAASPLVNFSEDDSNSEDERMQATENAIRGCGLFNQKPVPNGLPLPPWASNK